VESNTTLFGGQFRKIRQMADHNLNRLELRAKRRF